jgi:prepilin-type N-terminal cleavage/methylation domain-containing protein
MNQAKSPGTVSRQGFTLVEIMVVMAMMGITAMAMMSLQTHEQKRMVSIRQMTSRDAIKALADRYILDATVVGKSASSANYTHITGNSAGNQALDYCLNGAPATGPAPACAPNCCKAVTDQPFVLLDPSDSAMTRVFAGTDSASAPKAATSAAPARYDINGAICTAASPQCPLELVTTFNATCAGGAPQCAQADQVFISYTLRGAPGVQPAGGTPMKALTPAMPVLLTSAAGGPSGAGGGSGVVILKKCAKIIASAINPDCTYPGNGPLACTPPNCPAGYTDDGTHSETTGVGGTSTSFFIALNCVRTCYK